MTELGYPFQAQDLTMNEDVYLAEDVEALLEEKENQILSLKKEIKGLHVALSLP